MVYLHPCRISLPCPALPKPKIIHLWSARGASADSRHLDELGLTEPGDGPHTASPHSAGQVAARAQLGWSGTHRLTGYGMHTHSRAHTHSVKNSRLHMTCTCTERDGMQYVLRAVRHTYTCAHTRTHTLSPPRARAHTHTRQTGFPAPAGVLCATARLDAQHTCPALLPTISHHHHTRNHPLPLPYRTCITPRHATAR